MDGVIKQLVQLFKLIDQAGQGRLGGKGTRLGYYEGGFGEQAQVECGFSPNAL